MAVTGVGTTNTSAQTQSATGLAANFETFMTLLTAQLRAQDPLSPLDTKDFTNQLVQFTGVEQQLKTNELLTTLNTNMNLSAGSLAVSYLGKEATANTNVSGFQNGKATWEYNLPQLADNVSLKIYDEKNKLVKTIDGEKTQGAHTLEWDGSVNSGDKKTSGQYTLVIEAKNSSGSTINGTITKKGIISDVDMSGSEPQVTINGAIVPLSSVSKLKLASN